ncbi:MAG TPA: hypothetical protein VJA94_23905 [Candidatus Angelobacter sp.]
MNHLTFEQSSMRRHARRLSTVLLFLWAALTVAQGKEKTSGAVKVVASLTFNNKLPADMQIQEFKGKPYLFVQMANAQGVVIVDISKPNKLKIVSSLSSPDACEACQLSVNGNAAAITTVAVDASSPPATKDELALWDISKPGNPREVQHFSGVVRVLHDERNYTYVLNQDGLWVVFDKQTEPADEDNNWLQGISGG